MAVSLIMHKRITTTVAKAKALKMFIEPIITKSKSDTTPSRRNVFSYLKDKNATTELFRVIAPKVANRPGGYTRILKTGFRQSDAAEMCFIELVDFNDVYSMNKGTAKASDKPKTRRSSKKKATEAPAAEAPAAAETTETPAAE